MNEKTYSVPSVSVLGENLVLVGEPVSIPSPESCRVVNTDSVNSLDLKSSALDGPDIVVERSRGIGTREDVFVHEKTPDEILILPALSQSSDLQEENSVIVHHFIALSQEASKMSNTNVFGHFKTGDLVVFSFWNRDITIVHAENVALLLGDASLAKSIVAPSGLVATKGDTSSFCTIVDTSKFCQGSPSASNI